MEPRRILCIAFPSLSSDRALRALGWPAATPLVLVERRHAVVRVAALSGAAAGAGLRVGMTLAEARAIVPTLRDLPHEPREDARALAGLAARLSPFAPLVGRADGRTLALDITGCAPHFGGERPLAEGAVAAVRAAGYGVRFAVAGTVGAARALSNFGADDAAIVAPGEEMPALVPLLPDALFPWGAPAGDAAEEAFRQVLDKLRVLGVRTVGALLRLPRSGLTARVGPEAWRRLDRALGLVPEPVVAERAVELPRAVRAFDGAVDAREPVLLALEALVKDLTEDLAARRLGAREVLCTIGRPDAPPEGFRAAFSEARREAAWLLAVLRTRLERVDLGRGVVAIELAVTAAEERPHAEPALFATKESPLDAAGDLRVLLDRFAARLGEGAAGWIALRADLRPEKAWILTRSPAGAGGARRPALRPARRVRQRFPVEVAWDGDGRPLRLRCAGPWRRVDRAVGPEILDTAWWDRRYSVRAFLVEVEGGACLSLVADAESGEARVAGVFD